MSGEYITTDVSKGRQKYQEQGRQRTTVQYFLGHLDLERFAGSPLQ